MHLADNISYLLSKHKMTGKELAEEMGWKATVISSYRNGTSPPLKNANRIAEFFQVSLDDLVNRDLREGYTKKDDGGSESDKVVIELLTKEVLRLRAKLKESGVEDAAIDKGFKIAVDQLREEK